MSTGKRVAIAAAAGLVLLFVLSVVLVVPALVNVDRYRPEVTTEIQKKTGKPVQIGHLALTLFPQVAIRVDNFALANPAGFPAGNFVSAEKVYAVVKAGALLRHQVEITSLELDDLSLNLLQDTHGKWNFDNPSAAENTDPPGNPPPGTHPASFTLGVISSLTVTRGQFAVASLLATGVPGPPLVTVQGASIELKQFNLSGFTNASLRPQGSPTAAEATLTGLLTTTAYAQEAPGPAVAQGSFRADALQFGDLVVTKVSSPLRLYPKQVFADDLNLQCYGGSAKGSLALDFTGVNLKYNVNTQLKGVNVGDLLNAFPQARGMMTGTLEGTAKLNGLVTHSSNPLAGITGSGQAAIHNGKLPSLRLSQNLRDMAKLASIGPSSGDPSSFSSLSADFQIADDKLVSNNIVLVGSGMDVTGAGNLSMAGEGSLDYHGDAGLAAGADNPLTTIVAGLSGGKVSNGKITFPFTVVGTFARPKFSLSGVGGGATSGAQAPVDLVRGLSGLFKKKK